MKAEILPPPVQQFDPAGALDHLVKKLFHRRVTTTQIDLDEHDHGAILEPPVINLGQSDVPASLPDDAKRFLEGEAVTHHNGT